MRVVIPTTDPSVTYLLKRNRESTSRNYARNLLTGHPRFSSLTIRSQPSHICQSSFCKKSTPSSEERRARSTKAKFASPHHILPHNTPIPQYLSTMTEPTEPTAENAITLFQSLEQKFPTNTLGPDRWYLIAVRPLPNPSPNLFRSKTLQTLILHTNQPTNPDLRPHRRKPARTRRHFVYLPRPPIPLLNAPIPPTTRPQITRSTREMRGHCRCV